MKAFCLAALLLAAGNARAQKAGDGVVVYFTDGSRLSGILTSLTDDSVGLRRSGMETSWPRSEVERIAVRPTPEQTFNEMVAAAGDDPEKLSAAAEYAQEHQLYTDYNRLAGRLGLDQWAEPPAAPDGPDEPPPEQGEAGPSEMEQQEPSPAAEPSPAPPAPPALGMAPAGSVFTTPAPVDPGLAADATLVYQIDPYVVRRDELARREEDLKTRERARGGREAASSGSDFQSSLQQFIDRKERGLP